MKNLYIVESPLQVLNAFEAIHAFPAQKNEILVRYSGFQENDKQIFDTLLKLKIDVLASIKTVTINGEKRNIVDVGKLLWLKLTYLLRLAQFDKIFLGNYDSRFIRFIIPLSTKIILMDDGSGSINVQSQFTSSNFYNWFTIFDLKPFVGQQIMKNEYSELNTIINNHISQNSETVLFVGSKISEIGITTEENYLNLVKKICQRFTKKTIIYIAHRGEDQRKLNLLEKNNNLKVTLLNYPIEMLSIYGEITPSKIISFYSTALITLSKIYKVETIAFKFDYSKSEYKDGIERVYNYCSNFMTVVEEENI